MLMSVYLHRKYKILCVGVGVGVCGWVCGWVWVGVWVGVGVGVCEGVLYYDVVCVGEI